MSAHAYVDAGDGTRTCTTHDVVVYPEELGCASTGRVIAAGREETEPCQAGTPGCSIDHTRDSGDGCEGW
jgi:hypothetical protein